MMRILAIPYLCVFLFISACSGETTPTVQPASIQPADFTAIPVDPTASDTVQSDASIDHPAWQTVELVDARTGSTFTFADFTGKTVFVEPMATWCTNCRRQLGNVRQASEQLAGDESYVFVGLSVETNLSALALAEYTEDQGFPWTFAVLTPTALQALVDTFGRTVSNPPSTPHFIIRPDGTFTEIKTGYESAEEIIENLREANGA